MRITKEWLQMEMNSRERNIKFLEEKVEKEGDVWKELLAREEGELDAYQNMLFHKSMSGKTCKIFSKSVPMWKRKIIRFLTKICDYLEGVEIESLTGKDYLEDKNDRNIINKRTRI